jgi:hypothetical protein
VNTLERFYVYEISKRREAFKWHVRWYNQPYIRNINASLWVKNRFSRKTSTTPLPFSCIPYTGNTAQCSSALDSHNIEFLISEVSTLFEANICPSFTQVHVHNLNQNGIRKSVYNVCMKSHCLCKYYV